MIDEQVGRVIGDGKYRLLSVIGQGGMATVYSAEQLNVPRTVAIKMAHPMLSQQPVFVERFRREVRAIALLEHEPHILPLYDVGEEGGLLYMVMPLISGGTLRDRLAHAPGQPWSARAALDLGEQVLAALDYAHAQGFIHRDVKPSNILCEGDRLYLADFGIAKAIQEAAGGTGATILGGTLTGAALIGTPTYMAPEQVLGLAVDRRTDLYAFGVVLYEVLTGRVPYTGDSPQQVAFRHVESSLPPPRELNPNLSLAVEAVLLKALAREQPDRFSSAGEFATALKAAVAADATPGQRRSAGGAPRTIASAPLRRTRVRRRLLLAGGAAVALTGSAALWLRGRWPLSPPELLPSMAKARSFFAATHLPSNGGLLVIGGQEDDQSFLANAELYDPVANRWVPSGLLGTGRVGHTSTLLADGQVLVVGGQVGVNPPTYTAAVERYNPTTSNWSITTELATPRMLHQALALPNGQVLVVGGFSGAAYVATAEQFDPTTAQWRTLRPMANPRVALAAALLLPNGQVLVTGGFSGDAYLSSAERYDPASDSWTSAGEMSAPRAWHTATALPDGQVLVVGGYLIAAGRTTFHATAERYDPFANRWIAAGTMAATRSAHTASLLPDGQVLVAGGQNGRPLASAERYDPIKNTWAPAGQMATPRTQHQSGVLPNGHVLVAGGQNSSTDSFATATVERYDPATNRWSDTRSD